MVQCVLVVKAIDLDTAKDHEVIRFQLKVCTLTYNPFERG